MKIIVFGAHPDDEVIGLGGTLKKWAQAGADIRLILFSAGAEGYTQPGGRDRIIAQRRAETEAVCAILGIRSYANLGLLDWNLKVDNAAYHAVIREIRAFQPDAVFTHTRADYNDHIAVHDVVTEGWFHAALPCAMDDGPVWKPVPLYEFEVRQPMATPGLVVDISDTFPAKVEAMQRYASQLEHVGGVFQLMEGRALDRGNLIGVRYGEALIRSAYQPRAIRSVQQLMDKT